MLERRRAKGLVAYDIMTERYEITSILQRELVNDARRLRRAACPARATSPGVFMESVHYLLKTGGRRAAAPAGVVLRRPRSRARG